MRITDIQGLYVAYCEEEDFSILICAQDEAEAKEIALTYFEDGGFENFDSCRSDLLIKEFDNTNEHFDCDYVVTYGGDL